MIKETWGGKDLFAIYFHCTVHHQRKSGQELTQGRILKPGTDAKAMEGYLLTGLPSLLSYRTEDYQPTMDWALSH